jgi:hypothetical protein
VRSIRLFVTASPQSLPGVKEDAAFIVADENGADKVRIRTAFMKERS